MFIGKRILAVDDSPTTLSFLESLLGTYGSEVLGAVDGEQGLERYRSEGPFDLVLLDLLLPDINGIEILQRIRVNDQQTTVVMLTGEGDIHTAIASVQSGADGFIEKEEISIEGDQAEFIYKLQQAMQQRQGLVAQAELERLKADFYTMITHDLRNPTSTISMALEILEDDETGPLNDFQQEIVDTMREGANRLLHLINNYLDFSLLEVGSFELMLEPIDLRTIVESCIRLAILPAQSKGLHLQHSISDHSFAIQGDGERLRRLIDNLVSNAIKYTPRDGRIEVRLEQKGDTIILQVTDSGYGFEPENSKLLFIKFHRLSGEDSHRAAGTGLGLAIAKEIAIAHGGSITAYSDGPNLGASFTVTLPISTPEKASSTKRRIER